MMIIQLMAVIIAGILDRIRGDAWHFGSRAVDKLLLGYCMAIVAGFPLDPIITPLITIMMMVGMSFGWGEPMGAILDDRSMDQSNLEWWQIGPMKTNAWVAIIARGALWGAPVALLGFLSPSLMWFVPAYMIAFPASLIVAKRFPFNDSWATSEYIRGWIAAIIVLIGSIL